MPSEDDVLHADKLPNYGDSLSREESETLLSYLTVDYIRIPLVVNFFASRDRVTYLFNRELQELLRSVLFQPGEWVAPYEKRSVDIVPVRQTAEQKQREEMERLLNAKRTKTERQILGTSTGLLLNELQHSPGGVLEPLLSMFNSIADLAKAPVNSRDASFILYLVSLALSVERYVNYAIFKPWVGQVTKEDYVLNELKRYKGLLSEFLHGTADRILENWRKEAEANKDMPTASVVHAYKALLWCNLRPEEYDDDNVSTLLGSLAYVHNWHGFGLGKVAQYEGGPGGDVDPEQRLLRFLQAYGVDTSRMQPGSLNQFAKVNS